MNRLQDSPGLFDSGRRLLDHALGAFSNRVELLAIEFKEEKTNVVELFICIAAALFFAMMTVIVLTATVILLFREEWRVYAAGGFCFIYLMGAIWSFLTLAPAEWAANSAKKGWMHFVNRSTCTSIVEIRPR